MSKLVTTLTTPTIFLVILSLVYLDVCHAAKNNIIDINHKGVFNAAVLRNQKPVVVFFTKSNCSQCKNILKELEKKARENDETMYLARVDLEKNPNLWKEFEIKILPTTRTYYKGQKLREVEGPLLGGITAITNNAIKYGLQQQDSNKQG